jgi:starch phosphorylase
VLKGVVDRFYSQIGGFDFSHIADYLINSSFGVADPFMCLADFDSYLYTYKTALADYKNSTDWARKSLINTAESGIFSSDNSINKYAREIWRTKPVNKTNAN